MQRSLTLQHKAITNSFYLLIVEDKVTRSVLATQILPTAEIIFFANTTLKKFHILIVNFTRFCQEHLSFPSSGLQIIYRGYRARELL